MAFFVLIKLDLRQKYICIDPVDFKYRDDWFNLYENHEQPYGASVCVSEEDTTSVFAIGDFE